MADQQSRGGQNKGMISPDNLEKDRGVHPKAKSKNPTDEAQRELERRQKNQDDPSRAPESGDRK